MDGEGANLYGGRWNHPGRRVIYLAQSKALAALEILVHVDRSLLSALYLIFPVSFQQQDCMALSPLPDGWNSTVAPETTMQAGDNWIDSQLSPVLLVPSVIISGEYNYLFNPNHPDAEHIQIGHPINFSFDNRI